MLQAGDCLELMRAMPDDSVDLVFTSPPYEAARTYGMGFKYRGQDWVDWMVQRCREMARICRGVVCINCEGQTRGFNYSGAPFLLLADLKRAGFALRKPLVFHRVGIPGSGGPDWFRNDWEPVICFQGKAGKLPWSQNTAMGHKPKWAPGGAMSNRHADGQRKNARDKADTRAARLNQWGHSINSGATVADAGGVVRSKGKRPSHKPWGEGGNMPETKKGDALRRITKQKEGMHGGQDNTHYAEPTLANPGNLVKCNVGGGVMGSALAHENEAPFPEKLAEFFVRSLCPPDGIVLDPFSGSGTVAAVAKRTGRRWIGYDIRPCQIELAERRLATVQPELIP